MIEHPRFTLQTLDKLNIPRPNADIPLNTIDHPLINQAKHLRFGVGETGLEKIKCIDDNVLYKCKPNAPIRGAIWIDSIARDCAWWIVDAGKREDGSKNDFYSQLELSCVNKLKSKRRILPNFNIGKKTYSNYLLPTTDDYQRIKEEESYFPSKHIKNELIKVFNESCVYPDRWIDGYLHDCPFSVLTLVDGNKYLCYIAVNFRENLANGHKAMELANIYADSIGSYNYYCTDPQDSRYPSSDYLWLFMEK